ncbi:hypothetical protein C7271_03605 [filamentous cyanobacterium CCP5]|nr:hypothetical protein C7271_03605 [filamentous cyanobacterium CCP5]
MGPPTNLISQLNRDFGIKTFVETGTYYGHTAKWAASIFQEVLTIEYSRELFEHAKGEHKDSENIKFLFGDSRTVLNEVLPNISSPVLFWLDAHWSGGKTYGASDQCPLIDEIEIINQLQPESFIFIDDARLFMSPPQAPHKIDQWPDIFSTLSALDVASGQRYSVIIEDVIISVPQYAKQTVAKYCQGVNTKIWAEYSYQDKLSNSRKALQLILEDIKQPIRSLKSKWAKAR